MATESDILNSLNLGRANDILKNKSGNPLSDLLIEKSNEIVGKLKEALAARDINTTSLGLSQSIGVDDNIEFTESKVSIGIKAEYYWKFVNYGVNGEFVNHGAPEWGHQPQTQSFSKAIREWIPKRGVVAQDGNYESLTFAIMTNIRKFGKEPRPFLQDVVNDHLIQELRKPIEALIGRAIEISISAQWQ